MFLSQYHHTIDAKGRLSIPGKYREVLARRYGDGLVLAQDPELCLALHPMEEWRRLADRIKTMPATAQVVKDYKRFVHGHAVDCALDKQGRILVPPQLREFAGLERDAVLVGVDDHVEVWSAERWRVKSERMAQQQEMERIMGAVTGYGV